jgi:hypothetical protein
LIYFNSQRKLASSSIVVLERAVAGSACRTPVLLPPTWRI